MNNNIAKTAKSTAYFDRKHTIANRAVSAVSKEVSQRNEGDEQDTWGNDGDGSIGKQTA